MNTTTLPRSGAPTAPPAAAEPVPTARTHLWFVVVLFGYLIDCADRFMVGAVLPAVKIEFALSDAQVGLLGGAFYLGLCLLAVPAGLVVDRTSRKYMISGMVAVWSLATLAMGSAQGFGAMVMSRIGVGLGEAGYNPAAYALISAWYPKRLRATMIGLFTTGAPLGAALGIGLAGYITHHFGWRHVFGVMAVPGLVLAVLFLFAPDYRTRRVQAGQSEIVHASIGETMRFIFGTRALLLLFLTQLVIFIYVGGVNVWGTVFMMRAFGLDVARASGYVVVVVLFGALGAFFGGVMSDALKRRGELGRIQSILISLAMLAVFGALYYLTPRLHGGLAFGVAMACGAQFSQATIWASLVAAALDLVPPHFRATTMSCEPLFQGISAFIAPPLVGWISDHSNLTLALQAALLVSIVGCALLMWAARASYHEDAEKQKRLGSFALDIG